MIDQAEAATLRRWAIQCASEADNPRSSGAERERLLKMRTALLELADTKDWLDGQSGAMRLTG